MSKAKKWRKPYTEPEYETYFVEVIDGDEEPEPKYETYFVEVIDRDEEDAHQWRLKQAQELLDSLEVVEETEPT